MNIFKLIADNNAKVNLGMIQQGFLQITISNSGRVSQTQVSPQTITQANPETVHAILLDLIQANIRKASETEENPSQEQSEEAEGTEDVAG